MKNTHIILTGPSGAGKTTLGGKLLEQLPGLARFVTTTTRPKRSNEVEGRDYYFIAEAEFKRGIANDEFFEWDLHYGFLYGSNKIKFMEFMSTVPLGFLVLDPTGAQTVKRVLPEVVTIFIKLEFTEDLRARLSASERADDDPVARLVAIQTELQQADVFDHTVINRQGYFQETVDEVVAIIYSYTQLS